MAMSLEEEMEPMDVSSWRILLTVMMSVTAACGDDVTIESFDPSAVSHRDASLSDVDTGGDAASDIGDATFPPATSDELADEECDGGCVRSEYCAANHFFGGGRRGTESDAEGTPTPGCHTLPMGCADAETCACLLAATDADTCAGHGRDCVTNDAGWLLERCLIARP
jgi:hypothetical protein